MAVAPPRSHNLPGVFAANFFIMDWKISSDRLGSECISVCDSIRMNSFGYFSVRTLQYERMLLKGITYLYDPLQGHTFIAHDTLSTALTGDGEDCPKLYRKDAIWDPRVSLILGSIRKDSSVSRKSELFLNELTSQHP